MSSCGPAHNIKTPFPFLKRAPPDQIRRIHEIILSNEAAVQKNIGIVNTIGLTTDYLLDYYVWIEKVIFVCCISLLWIRRIGAHYIFSTLQH